MSLFALSLPMIFMCVHIVLMVMLCDEVLMSFIMCELEDFSCGYVEKRGGKCG